MDTAKLSYTAQEIDEVIQNYSLGKNVNLGGAVDYTKWVLKLVPVDEGEYKFISGDILFIRDNSIYPVINVIINMAKIWAQPVCRCDNFVISGVDDSCSLCTFIHNGKKYYGIHWYGAANPTFRLVHVKINNVPIEEIVYETTNGTQNAEVAQSVVNINWDGTPKT